MRDQEIQLTIEDLSRMVDVPVHTIRFCITEGLIPGPDGRGKSTIYTEEHLLKLRLVRRLSEQRVPLVDIRTQLVGLTLDDVRVLLREHAERDAELALAARDASPKAYVAAF
jgi:DNA-binding transcriptional MerR regulator